ncbi:MAG: type IV secretion system DNA-binding domain-containing protein [bacterium]|nr:type IV secretion system DNA-binding domain-containing protein [bacterium]
MPIEYDHEHDEEINFFAMTNFRNQGRKFGIKTDDRRRHMYVVGKTGMGKTTMLENMILNDINAGHAVAIVDPHGDTADKLLDYIPSNRINDVIYFNPADSEFPMAFNVLEAVNPLHKHLVAQGLMGVFKKIWPDVWSARMEHILNNCILALLDYPGSTLLGINRLLVDKNFRKRVVTKLRDPIVKAFWVDEYQVWEPRFRNEAIQPIQNKVGQFLSSSLIRNIVAQVKSTIDMRVIMDTGKIFIMNLSKGRLGEDTSRLLGGMLITKIQLAAMERVDIPEPERRDFYLYVDEFQNFATESFANILSEARKYRLNLIIAHQYIGQLITDVSTKVRDAVFGNVGTIVMFRIGAEDAEFVEKEFAPHFIPEDMVNLAKYDVYLKLMIDGVTSAPFSATTLSPIAKFQGQRDKIIKVSRERYAVAAAIVEEKVMRWTGMGELGEEEEGAPKVQPPSVTVLNPSKIPVNPVSHITPPREDKINSENVKMAETELVVKVAPEIKSISLSDAMQKKPVLIKLGPGGRPNGTPIPARPAVPLQQPQKQSTQQQSSGQKTASQNPQPPQINVNRSELHNFPTVSSPTAIGDPEPKKSVDSHFRGNDKSILHNQPFDRSRDQSRQDVSRNRNQGSQNRESRPAWQEPPELLKLSVLPVPSVPLRENPQRNTPPQEQKPQAQPQKPPPPTQK